MKATASLLLAAVLVAGCQGTGPRESSGGLLGAAAGGFLGSQFGSGEGKIAAAVVGALAGAYLGSEIGRQLDEQDRAYMRRTAGTALETAPDGRTLPWRNPDSGHAGSVTPMRTWQRADGTYCREFNQTVQIGGRTEQAYGTACRQPDGTWKIVG